MLKPKQRGAGKPKVFPIDDLKLVLRGKRILRKKHTPIALTPKQFLLFTLLVRQSPALVPFARIHREVFKCKNAGEFAINSLVHRLRKKLGRQLGRRVVVRKHHGWRYVPPIPAWQSVRCRVK